MSSFIRASSFTASAWAIGLFTHVVHTSTLLTMMPAAQQKQKQKENSTLQPWFLRWWRICRLFLSCGSPKEDLGWEFGSEVVVFTFRDFTPNMLFIVENKIITIDIITLQFPSSGYLSKLWAWNTNFPCTLWSNYLEQYIWLNSVDFGNFYRISSVIK